MRVLDDVGTISLLGSHISTGWFFVEARDKKGNCPSDHNLNEIRDL